MAPCAKLALVSFWVLSLRSATLAGIHHVSCFQLISPWAAPGLPKRLDVTRVNVLVCSAYDSNTGRLAPRSGYKPDSQESWSAGKCMLWESWVETKYQALVQEVNTSSPQGEPYYMQILKTCELDDATGAVRAVTRYSLNGEDVLRYQSDQNRWFSEHPAAWRVAERWNREGETFTAWNLIQPQHCRFMIELALPFIAQKTAQPTVHVALVPGTQDRPRRLVCHVTGFYPRDIEVIWERGGQVAQGEQLTSGILPNGDLTFQIQVSIELGQKGVGPAEHVCVVRHSSLGHDPLRVTWDSQVTGQTGVPAIVAGCILAALGVVALGWYLRRRAGAQKGPYRTAQTQPGTLDSAPAIAKPAGNSLFTASSCPDATE
ncbi:DLA class II histocompatibility antigen, DR-1 beta chain-like isoform X2 [Dermochelys coriacea]|uniref:DLA class II histocompatibility antigen, DR-1 beta chain-like isoform X2 n=1 Tax=Dermochelys coriacea TaxID=27794 RepID=UPI001CA915A1|nr:DLA class II histocompatibility antigen, DR-1 beta chain-like isoform X2 [Dermochelys coriacea]